MRPPGVRRSKGGWGNVVVRLHRALLRRLRIAKAQDLAKLHMQ